jgi:hypothetical protein
MVSTYFWCGDLLGSPLCGDKVRNMALCYYYCNSITGNPVCGNNVVDMRSAYYGCHMLTGSPAVGPNVINMSSAYSGCTNLTGNIKFGPNVTVINDAYNGCIHLTGTPYCPDAATNMAQTYRNCRNLTGNPVCGPNVTDMNSTYQDCTNLTGKPIFGNKVTNVAYTYANCPNVAQGNAYFIPTNMTNIAGCFMGKNNSKRLNVFVQANSSTYNLCMNNSRYYSLVYDDITWTNAGKYNYNIAYNIYVYAETNVQATMESNEDPTLIAVYTTTNTSMRTVHADVNSSYTAEVSGNTVRLTSFSNKTA